MPHRNCALAAVGSFALAASTASAAEMFVTNIGVMGNHTTTITVNGKMKKIYDEPQVFTLSNGTVVNFVTCVDPAGNDKIGAQTPPNDFVSESAVTYFTSHFGLTVGKQIQYLVNEMPHASKQGLIDLTDGTLVKMGVLSITGLDAAATADALSTATASLGTVWYSKNDPHSQVVDLPGVPEPTTWALMLIGIGSMGAALRHERRFKLAIA
jgi:hypothetical protein